LRQSTQRRSTDGRKGDGLLDGEVSRTSSDERSATDGFAYAAASPLAEPSIRPQRNPEFRRAMTPAHS
jgi:hypothetical protein